MKKAIRTIVEILLPILVFYGLLILIAFNSMIALLGVDMAIRFIIYSGEMNRITLMEKISNTNEFYDILSILFEFVSLIVMAAWYRMESKKRIVVNEKMNFMKLFFTMALLGFTYKLFVLGGLNIILKPFPDLVQNYNNHMEQNFSDNMIVLYLTVVILGPMKEEFMFRGIILRKLKDKISFPVANVIQAVLFAIFHLNIVQAMYAFVGGLLLGYIAHRYKNILASIMLHMILNAYALLIVYLPFDSNYLLVYLIFGLCGLIPMLVVMLKHDRLSRSMEFIPIDNLEGVE